MPATAVVELELPDGDTVLAYVRRLDDEDGPVRATASPTSPSAAGCRSRR